MRNIVGWVAIRYFFGGMGNGQPAPWDHGIRKDGPMHMQVVRRRPLALVVLTLAGTLLAGAPGADGARLTTKSPEVLQAIDRGIKFLESDTAKDDRVGAQALIGLALLKNGAKPDHPKVMQAVARIQKALASRDTTKANPELDIYSTGLAIIFLVERDPAAPPRRHRVPVGVSPGAAEEARRLGLPGTGNRRHLDDPVRGAQLVGGPARRIQRPHGLDRSGDCLAAEDPRPQRRLRLSRRPSPRTSTT